jgi:UDPglucose--hexose-1-phosphate uridylyltransferase
MRRTATTLADGRELIYFDDDETVQRGVQRQAQDLRDLPPQQHASELRYDPLLDEWVAIASHRQDRTHLPPSDECPLCPSQPDRLTEIPSDDYDVVVFENRFPSLAPDTQPPLPLPGGEPFGRRPGIGRCEVVCFTSEHDSSFASLPVARVRTVIDAWADRTAALAQIPGVEQVFCFENRGAEIGVTLAHPHGQIYAYPFVTPRTQRMLATARKHQERTGTNLFEDVLAAEQKSADRIVAESAHWVAFVPMAARWPFEVHLYPRRRVPDLPALTDAERDDFAALYLDVLARMDGLFGTPLPYIAAWHQAPVREDHDLAYLHMQLFSIRRGVGKLKYLAGSESGMGVFVNDIAPERAAQMLRAAGGAPRGPHSEPATARELRP